MRARFLWRAMKARFRDQRAELGLIRAHLQSGDFVCDIGAHKGSYTFWLSRWVKNGRVIAFEPQPALAAYLRLALAGAGCRNVIVEEKGVAAATGEATFFIPSPNSPGASFVMREEAAANTQRLSVPVVALDDYFPPDQRIALLKIDAEGMEEAIFQGARRILRESRPVLIFECENRHMASGSVADVIALLRDFGYEGAFFGPDGALRPVAEFDAGVHQRQHKARFWDDPAYCNNFVFRPRRAVGE